MKTQIFRLFAWRSLGLLLAFGLLFSACNKERMFENSVLQDDPILARAMMEDSITQDMAEATNCLLPFIKREDVTPTGDNIIELEDGFRIEEGLLSIKVGEQELKLLGVSAEVRFCEEGYLKSLNGQVAIPSPTECLSFGNLLRTDIGYFPGDYINTEFELDFPLPVDQSFFVFYIATNLGVEICTGGDEGAQPISISIPGSSGQLLYILNPSDPFYFIEVEHELVGRMALAESAQGNILYTPLQPIPEMPAFDCKSYVSGDIPIYKVIKVNGDLYLNKSFLFQLAKEKPFDFDVQDGFKAGANGDISISVDIGPDSSLIADLMSFSIPLGEASAAITAVPDIDSQLVMRAFINTRIDPDDSWWPAFIPAKPNAEMDIIGYVQSGGQFYFVMRGEMGIQTTAEDTDLLRVAAELQIDNEQLLLRGELDGPRDGWAIQSTINLDQSEVSVEIPENLIENLSFSIQAELDQMIFQIDSLNNLFSEAEENFAFELSLRGVKAAIPDIANTAKDKIEAGVRKAKADARRLVPPRIPRDFKLCSSPYGAIDRWIDAIAKPYYDVINALRAAVDPELSDESVRIQLKKALQDLLDRKTINAAKTFSFKVGPKRLRCRNITSRTVRVTIRFSTDVLTDDHVSQLEQAIANLQYIQPAADEVVRIGDIIGELPPREIHVNLKGEIESGAQSVPQLDKVGYILQRDPLLFTFYAELDGQRVERDFDPFDWKSIVRMVIEEIRN